MKPHGCHNRPPLRTRAMVQDGWFLDGVTRMPRMIAIPDPMTKECQYTKLNPKDERCKNCKNKRES